MNTQTKLAAALLLVLFTAVTTTATLGYFIYERTLASLVTSRFEFIAHELEQKVEAGLDLGLPLGELENIDALLRQERAMDGALANVSIRNTKGVVLFDTDASRIGTRLAEPWLERIVGTGADADAKSGIHLGETEIATPLVNSFGKVVGGLKVEFSRTYYEAKRTATLRSLAELTLIVLSTSGFIGLCGVLAMSRPLETTVVRLQASARTLLLRMGAVPSDAAATDDLETEITAFENRVLAAVASLEQAEATAHPAATVGCARA